MKNIGISNIVFGIMTISISCIIGVVFIVTGAKLLSRKSDLTF